MPQDSDQEKQLCSQMREGRKPLIEACRTAYQKYLIAQKSWGRQNDVLREQVGLLSSEFGSKGKQLRDPSRTGTDMVEAYKALSEQARAVSALIDKELPNLTKLYDPVGKLHAQYKQALADYETYMAQYKGKLPDGDLNRTCLARSRENPAVSRHQL